jgi:hypothetical protein
MCFMSKRNLNVGECEIARAYKLTPKGFVEVLSFNVPRKVERRVVAYTCCLPPCL